MGISPTSSTKARWSVPTANKTFHVDRYAAGRDDFEEDGISDLHREFDPSEYGYMPFNEQFAYAPGEHGYQPLNERFAFDEEDLYKDPGYKFRLEQGTRPSSARPPQEDSCRVGEP